MLCVYMLILVHTITYAIYGRHMRHTENQEMRALPHRARLGHEDFFLYIRICPFKNKYGSSFFFIMCQHQAALHLAEEFHILLFFSALSLELE